MLTRRIVLALPVAALAQEAPKRGWRKATDAELRTAGPAAGSATAGEAAPEGGVVFRANVSQVRVDAEVYDSTGVINGLHRQDFRVFDNEQEKDVASCTQDDVSLDVMLLFDISGSMRPAVERVADSASEAFGQLRNGDRVAVMTFNSDTNLLISFSTNLERVADVIDRDVLGGGFGSGTLIQNGVSDAASVFMKDSGKDRRRAMIVITDNEGQRTRREESLLKELWEADVTLCGLLTGSGFAGFGGRGPRRGRSGGGAGPGGTWSGPLGRGPIGLPFPGGGGQIPGGSFGLKIGIDNLAEKTGGEMVPENNPRALVGLMKRLRQRYALYYSMPEATPGAQRSVRVELAQDARSKYPAAHVRSRKGYIAPTA